MYTIQDESQSKQKNFSLKHFPAITQWHQGFSLVLRGCSFAIFSSDKMWFCLNCSLWASAWAEPPPLTHSAKCECFKKKRKALWCARKTVFSWITSLWLYLPLTVSNRHWQNIDGESEWDAGRLNCNLMTWGAWKSASPTGGLVPYSMHAGLFQPVNTMIILINKCCCCSWSSLKWLLTYEISLR